jgi:uncharacterized protein YpmS
MGTKDQWRMFFLILVIVLVIAAPLLIFLALASPEDFS